MRKTQKYWQIQINKLIQFCQEKKWSLTFKGNGPDICFLSTNEIEVGLNQSKESLLYSLLHEIGHLIEHQNKTWYKKKYKGLNYNRGSKIFKISFIFGEYSAWEVGLRLAKKLDIEVNEKNFLRIKSACLFTYLEQVVSSGRSRIDED